MKKVRFPGASNRCLLSPGLESIHHTPAPTVGGVANPQAGGNELNLQNLTRSRNEPAPSTVMDCPVPSIVKLPGEVFAIAGRLLAQRDRAADAENDRIGAGPASAIGRA